MKNTMTILILLISLTGLSQDDYGSRIAIQFVQDGKLMFLEDDHGNKPITWDIQTSLIFDGKERNIGHYRIGCKFEYADLNSGNYKRFGMLAGYQFTNLPIPLTKYKYSLSPTVGWGYMHHIDPGYISSFEFATEFSVRLTKWIDFVVLPTVTQRQDLKQYGDEWRFNLAAGVQFNIDTNYLKKQANKGTRF